MADFGNKLTPMEFVDGSELKDIVGLLYDLMPGPYATEHEQWTLLAEYAATKAKEALD